MDIIDRVLEISNEKEGKTLVEMTLKCAEEVGELSQAVLSYTNACGCGYKNLGIEHVAEEIVDVFLVIIALAAKAGLTQEDMMPIIEEKLIKWQDKIK